MTYLRRVAFVSQTPAIAAQAKQAIRQIPELHFAGRDENSVSQKSSGTGSWIRALALSAAMILTGNTVGQAVPEAVNPFSTERQTQKQNFIRDSWSPLKQNYLDLSDALIDQRTKSNLERLALAIDAGRTQDALNLLGELESGTPEKTKKFLRLFQLEVSGDKNIEKHISLVRKLLADVPEQFSPATILRVNTFLKNMYTPEEFKALRPLLKSANSSVPALEQNNVDSCIYFLSMKDKKEIKGRDKLMQKIASNERLTNEDVESLRYILSLNLTPRYRDEILKTVQEDKTLAAPLRQSIIAKTALLTVGAKDSKDDQEMKDFEKMVEDIRSKLTKEDCELLYQSLKQDKGFRQKYKDKYKTDEALKQFAFAPHVTNHEKFDRLDAVNEMVPIKKKDTDWVMHQLALLNAMSNSRNGIDFAKRDLGILLENHADPFPRTAASGINAITNAILSLPLPESYKMLDEVLGVLERKGVSITEKPDYTNIGVLRALSLTNPKNPRKMAALERLFASNDNPKGGYRLLFDLPDGFGVTPLMSSAVMGDSKYTEALLTRPEIDVNRRDKSSDQMTALGYAIHENHYDDVVAFLEAHKRGTHKIKWDLSKKDSNPLVWATGNQEIRKRNMDDDIRGYMTASKIADVIQSLINKETTASRDTLVSLQKILGKHPATTP